MTVLLRLWVCNHFLIQYYVATKCIVFVKVSFLTVLQADFFFKIRDALFEILNDGTDLSISIGKSHVCGILFCSSVDQKFDPALIYKTGTASY